MQIQFRWNLKVVALKLFTHRIIPIKKMQKTNIAVYILEQNILGSDHPNRMKLDKTFFEVIHNNDTTYIRKSAVVWLLQ